MIFAMIGAVPAFFFGVAGTPFSGVPVALAAFTIMDPFGVAMYALPLTQGL